ncbi:uncharacterized protein M421DRAFT_94962 [Didymella exigua CBS 183.55]|uniref:Uncharacterized protein n=1 Tax=Didymella exigua CBS 183.55 TaxID=1150837 RepID=A0A6A5RBX1_9PLEO|nr:uncharacterized protein M421DRAFT_94962 [Didymella exigua CBS 183.55]KAF1925162.1 hypothetical protein M421DRAFT_94962 [Didymella exigua CBS 183.55]
MSRYRYLLDFSSSSLLGYSSITMPRRSQHSSGTLTCSHDDNFETDASSFLSQDFDIEIEPSEDYGVVHDEVQQDPRIGLALNADFANPTLAEGPIDLLADEDVRIAPVLQDLMFDYAEYLSQAAVKASVDGTSTSPYDNSDKYETDNTETNWDDQEDTLLDVYAGLHTDLFQSQIGMRHSFDELQVSKPATTAVLILQKERKLSSMPYLTMSPVIQVAMFDSQSVAFSIRITVHEPAASSQNDFNRPNHKSVADKACVVAPIVRTELIDAAHLPGSFPDFHRATVPKGLHKLAGGQSYAWPLRPEDSASNIVVAAKHLNISRAKAYRVTKRLDLGCEPDDLLKYVPEQLHSDVKEWLQQVELVEFEDEDHETFVAAPSFFTWLEHNCIAEHVLNTSIVVALAAVALTGHIYW